MNSHKILNDWIKLFQGIANVRHVILYADRKTLTDRINNDAGRDKEFALSSIDNNERYYGAVFEGSIKIDTSIYFIII